MKNTLFTLMLSFIIVNAYSQAKLKQVTVKHKNPQFTEKFYVEKENKNIRHGEYRKLGYEDCLLKLGYYNNNKKDSLWKEYRWSSTELISQGYYENDKKVSVWEYYDHKNRILCKFDYDSLLVVEYNWYEESDLLNVKIGDNWKEMKADSPPLSLDTELSTFIGNNLNYPIVAQENAISGQVIIVVRIDKTGKVKEYRIHKSVHQSLDEESLRVIKEIENWYPAIVNNEKVECEYLIPVTFKLM